MLYRHKIAAIIGMGTYLLDRGIAPANLLRRLDPPISLLLEEHAWLDRRSSLLLSLEIARTTNDPLPGRFAAGRASRRARCCRKASAAARDRYPAEVLDPASVS